VRPVKWLGLQNKGRGPNGRMRKLIRFLLISCAILFWLAIVFPISVVADVSTWMTENGHQIGERLFTVKRRRR
jgi:hypothetical protein